VQPKIKIRNLSSNSEETITDSPLSKNMFIDPVCISYRQMHALHCFMGAAALGVSTTRIIIFLMKQGALSATKPLAPQEELHVVHPCESWSW
jgi:hypothetical protein